LLERHLGERPFMTLRDEVLLAVGTSPLLAHLGVER
jgi:hypothetical protein